MSTWCDNRLFGSVQTDVAFEGRAFKRLILLSFLRFFGLFFVGDFVEVLTDVVAAVVVVAQPSCPLLLQDATKSTAAHGTAGSVLWASV